MTKHNFSCHDFTRFWACDKSHHLDIYRCLVLTVHEICEISKVKHKR